MVFVVRAHQSTILAMLMANPVANDTTASAPKLFQQMAKLITPS